MQRTVIKRDGREVDFDITKIEEAIRKANNSVDSDKRISDETFGKVMEFIADGLKNIVCIGVEDIQDLVENALMNKNCYEVAKAYILYRNKRSILRLTEIATKKKQ